MRPDIFRVDYGNLGVYSSQNQLLDVSPYFTARRDQQFTPAMWRPCRTTESPTASLIRPTFGTPGQHAAAERGRELTSPPPRPTPGHGTSSPTSRRSSRHPSPADKYPFVYNWQLGGTPRWLSWLFQADGALLGDDGTTTPQSTPPPARSPRLHPFVLRERMGAAHQLGQAATYADSFFTEESVAMAFVGSFVVPDIENLAGFD